jgi:hypothetical protein
MAKYIQYSTGLALYIRQIPGGQHVTQGRIVGGRWQYERSYFIEATPRPTQTPLERVVRVAA